MKKPPSGVGGGSVAGEGVGIGMPYAHASRRIYADTTRPLKKGAAWWTHSSVEP